MATTSQHALGKTRVGDATRVWFEKKRLLDFPYGKGFKKTWGDKKLTITAIGDEEWDELSRDERGTVEVNVGRPTDDALALESH